MDNPRIEDLRRRVEKDPASIAFAQLAEEYRRAGQLQESVETCRGGLTTHPGYLSARVTLGRALLELGEIDEAQRELELVLRSAPENLAAVRGLAEIHHQRGALDLALQQYEIALGLARNDPDLQETVTDLKKTLGLKQAAQPQDGLSFEQMRHELARHAPSAPAVLTSVEPTPEVPNAQAAPRVAEAPKIHAAPRVPEVPKVDPAVQRAHHTVAALDQWLSALHVTRHDRSP